jgi:transcriptional regulator with XRE-family HTH domain
VRQAHFRARGERNTSLSLAVEVFASRLRGYRHREALTQAELAGLAGVSKQNISDMENGRRGIGKDMAQRLGKALNAPWKRFL